MMDKTKPVKIILIHGNGGKPTDNWLPYLKTELEKLDVEVLARQFPDPDLARAKFWLPFLKNDLQADENTIIVGHSSGAIAAMRFAEKNKLLGSVLVAAYHTDLGYENERLSGYFEAPWDWEAIKKNQQWIVQFASMDDPWIPISEPRLVRDHLQSEYHEYPNRAHFCELTLPEAVAEIRKKLVP